MAAINPLTGPVAVANGVECVKPLSMGFRHAIVYNAALDQIGYVNGAQWQDQLGFPYAQTFFFRNGDGAAWEIRNQKTNWSWIIPDTITDGFIPFETPGGQIDFSVAIFTGGAFVPVGGTPYALDFRLYTSSISPILM